MSRQRVILWPVLCVVIVALAVWWQSVGNPVAYVQHTVPPGQVAYIFSKLAGLIAVGLLMLQVCLALARRWSGSRPFVPVSRRTHIVLGLFSLLLVLAHVGLFFTAASLRTNHLAIGLLIPTFTSGFYKFYVSVGLIALVMVLVTALAGWWRSRSGARSPRWLHWAAIPGIPLAGLHAFMIGSDARQFALALLAALTALLLLAYLRSRLMTFRLKGSETNRRLGVPAHDTNP